MRIVVIGGSSFSTPTLLKFLDSKADLARMEVVLVGRSRERVEAVCRASRLLIREELKIRGELAQSNNWRKILDGADTVVVQIRVGGFEGRLLDEAFPNKYGLCGDEGLGVGGISAGWRTWPVLSPMLEAIAEFCPRAFVILMTSPLSSLVRASLKHVDLNLMGICELPWTTLQELSRSLNLQPSDVQSDYLGVNHFGWLFNIQSGARDLLVDLVASQRPFPTSQLLRDSGCFPTRYLRMHYHPDVVLAEQTLQKMPRAEFLRIVQQRSYYAYLSGRVSEIASALEVRSTPWYGEAVGPLLLARCGQQVEVPFFLSTQNGTHVPFLASNDIIECRHHWVEGRLLRSPLIGAPPKHVIENLVPIVQFERAATEAIMARSTRLLRDALSVHPWIRDHGQLESIVDEIVSANDVILSTAPRG